MPGAVGLALELDPRSCTRNSTEALKVMRVGSLCARDSLLFVLADATNESRLELLVFRAACLSRLG